MSLENWKNVPNILRENGYIVKTDKTRNKITKKFIDNLFEYHKSINDVLIKIGKAYSNSVDSYLNFVTTDDTINVCYYCYYDNDHGSTFKLNIPYNLLTVDDTWEKRLKEFVKTNQPIRN